MYAIRENYQHRHNNTFFDDTPLRDEWQREVYQAAAEYASIHGANCVFDVGCGSGYKLVKYFQNTRTVGLDLEPTVTFLKSTYPGREWRSCDFNDRIEEKIDIVICADVVEHIPNPDEIMHFLARMNFKKLFISTPERNLLYGMDHMGPPTNTAHCREWSQKEFCEYVSRWFHVERHKITNHSQATQLVVCGSKI